MAERAVPFDFVTVKRTANHIFYNPGAVIEVVDGAKIKHDGFDYRSAIGRSVAGGVTAYSASHKLDTSNLWNTGEQPYFKLVETTSLEALDDGERVVLEAVVFEDVYMIEDEDGVLQEEADRINDFHMIRGGMVFDSSAIPLSERARMAKLFGL